MFVVCCLLFVVCCLLFVVCCLLFVVCCLLFVICFCFVLFSYKLMKCSLVALLMQQLRTRTQCLHLTVAGELSFQVCLLGEEERKGR